MRSWAGVHVLASDSRGLVTLMRLLRDPSASFSEDSGLQDVRGGWSISLVSQGLQRTFTLYCVVALTAAFGRVVQYLK